MKTFHLLNIGKIGNIGTQLSGCQRQWNTRFRLLKAVDSLLSTSSSTGQSIATTARQSDRAKDRLSTEYRRSVEKGSLFL